MKRKSEVLLAIKEFAREVGAPDSFVAGMSGEQMSSEVKKFCNDIGTTLRAFEEGTSWSNKAELYIGLIKEAVRKDMRESNSPLWFWDYCVERRARINNHTAKYAFLLHGLPMQLQLVMKVTFQICANMHGMNCVTSDIKQQSFPITRKVWAEYLAQQEEQADKAFVDDVRMAHQTITFCRVRAHDQNGVVERHIQDITENACTSLLHAAHRWPKAIAANLWPQAIKHVVNVCNSHPRQGKTELPLSKFAGMSIQPILRISILLVVLFMSSRHLSKPEVHFQNGENAQELAFPCAIPPSCIICPIGPINPNQSRQPTIPLCVR